MTTQTIPPGWTVTTLGEVAEIKHGYAFKGEYISDVENDNILLTPGNFLVGGGWKEGKKYYSGEIPDEYVLHQGDLVVTMTDLSKDGDTLGFPALIPNSPKKKYLHNQRVGLVIQKERSASKRYLYYLMCLREYQKHIVNIASGSTVRHTSPTKIQSFEFFCPLPSEQKAIAAVLAALDDKIELLRKNNKTLENIAQTLFKRWFVDYEFLNEKGKPYKSSGGKMIDSELGEIPAGWRVNNLGNVVDIRGGTTPSTANPDFWGGDIHWTSPKDLSNSKGLFLLDSESKITEVGLSQIGSGLLPRGTLLLSSRAPIGYLAISNIEISINQGYIAFLPGHYFSNHFMYLWLKNNMRGIVNAANGSTFLEISKSSFRNIESVVPTKGILDIFDLLVKPSFEKILSNTLQIQSLSRLRDLLLPKLMKGELRVTGFSD